MAEEYDLSINKFKCLPKTGKPKEGEWTVLATIIQEQHNQCKVVALGSGTKCLGRNVLNKTGFLVNDSHAEVLARRAFLRYIYYELEKAITKVADTIFEFDEVNSSFKLQPDIYFKFFCTQIPCGDACIDTSNEPKDDDQEIPFKRSKLNDSPNDDVFTGAKLIGVAPDDDALLQTVGAVRTKPGRGDRTLSVSCSDKLSKWCVLGVQGALLDMLLAKPIYFTTFNFVCDNTNRTVIERAFYDRWQHKVFAHSRYVQQRPVVFIHSRKVVNFEYMLEPGKKPSPNGLVWCDLPVDQRPYEVCVNGIRQGVTKNKLNTPQSALKISKFDLLQSYVSLLRKCPTNILKRIGLESEDQLYTITYADFKKLSICYQSAWENIKRDYFGQWTHKPMELTQFSLNYQT